MSVEEVLVSKEDFYAWKSDPTTKFIFNYLSDVADFTLETMTSKDLISNKDGLLRLNYLRGYVDAIDELLHLDPTIDENEENSNS